MRSTSDAAGNAMQDYSGCPGPTPAPAPNTCTSSISAAPTALRAVVLDGLDRPPGGDTPVELDVYLLDATKSGPGCIASADAVLETTVGPGTFYVVVDTTRRGAEMAGEYTLAVVPVRSHRSTGMRPRDRPRLTRRPRGSRNEAAEASPLALGVGRAPNVKRQRPFAA